jgi:hypothetical protein
MGYLIKKYTDSFPVKTLTILLKEPDLQILHSTPFLIYPASGTSTFVPVYAYLDATNASYNYQSLNFQDDDNSPTLTQGLLNLQALSGGVLSGSIFTFNMLVNASAVNGIRSVNNRDFYLKAENNDDLTGTGDISLTVYYFEI